MVANAGYGSAENYEYLAMNFIDSYIKYNSGFRYIHCRSKNSVEA